MDVLSGKTLHILPFRATIHGETIPLACPADHSVLALHHLALEIPLACPADHSVLALTPAIDIGFHCCGRQIAERSDIRTRLP